MAKQILFIFSLFLTTSLLAQKPQKVGYIDMQYILENVPEYANAQQQLNQKASRWQQNLDAKQKEINTLKEELANEKALLTKDLIEDRTEDIDIKEQEFRRLKKAYFGAEGDLFLQRKQLVKPVQDRIYSAVQEIAKRKKFDIIFDKSSDLIMLYTNSKYDISELVIKSITKTKKLETIQDKRAKKKKEIIELSDAAKEKQKERASKSVALKERIAAQKAAKAKKRAEMKKLIEEKRKAKIKAREEALKKRNQENEK